MPFSRPDLSTLVDRIEADFISRLDDVTSPVLRRSLVRVFSRVQAGAAHMLYGFIAWMGKQLFADTAEAEFLARWGSLFSIARNAPTYATGTVAFTGTDGSVIPAGSLLIRSDRAEYTTEAEVTIASGAATVAVTAVLAGADGDCDAGTVLQLESPVAGVDSGATSAAGLSGGTDEETEDEYRARVLARIRNAPQGGNDEDYIAWAREVPGVTRVWVDPGGLGAGTVVVRFVRDDDASPIPDAGEVATVQAVMDERAPVTAAVTVAAPIADALDFTLAVVPDTTAVRDAVQAELKDLLTREAEPGGTLLLSSIRTAIGIADGLTDYTLTSPAADVTHTTGHIATLGTITWS